MFQILEHKLGCSRGSEKKLLCALNLCKVLIQMINIDISRPGIYKYSTGIQYSSGLTRPFYYSFQSEIETTKTVQINNIYKLRNLDLY